MTAVTSGTDRTFHITILGRLLEHLGTQMYKQRAVAIAELVANSWDAGATQVHIELPDPVGFDRFSSNITVSDNGAGMDEGDVEDQYLVIGRNKREGLEGGTFAGRPVMGRKGIGKLAGFGIAQVMHVTTWKNGALTSLALDLNQLKTNVGDTKTVKIAGRIEPIPNSFSTAAGTKITLSTLKHKTPLAVNDLRIALARRFSRRTRGMMKIYVNNQEVTDYVFDFDERFPEKELALDSLEDGNKVTYYYGFTKKPIPERELRGFTIYVRGKTAQAPAFFFEVEAKAWGQHGAKYLTGEINADFLDEGVDEESDLISTDRQEIDWEDETTWPLKEWGQRLVHKVLRDRSNRKGQEMEADILAVNDFRMRIERLDPPSQKQVKSLLRTVGKSEPDPERKDGLADALIKAFEYRQFHDVIAEIESVSEDPLGLERLLTQLHQWKVLESRAILEIVRGRLEIIQKFHSMIVNDASETSRGGADNMHDLLGEYPWLLNPEWQVLVEERSISRTLKEWGEEQIPEKEAATRYDFLALTDEQRLVVIDIKRSGAAVELHELQRLESYKNALRKGSDKQMQMLMIHGGSLNVEDDIKQAWKDRKDGDIIEWNAIYEKTHRYYKHYEAVLTGEVDDPFFLRKAREVIRTRNVLSSGTVHRGSKARKEGLGSQDVYYVEDGSLENVSPQSDDATTRLMPDE